MASVSNPADVVNLALVRMGSKRRVGNLFDGSQEASQAISVYSQERDTLIRDGEWQFASRTITATLLKEAAPNYFDTPWTPTLHPPPPWRYEYAYPVDCLKVRQIGQPPTGLMDMMPRPVNWAINNDNGSVPAKQTVVTNVQDAILVYAGRVTNPNEWPSDFVEALAARLAAVLKPSLIGAITQIDVLDVTSATQTAQMEQG